MKKIIMSLLVLAASMNAMAITYTAKAKLTLASNNGHNCVVTVAQSDELGSGVTSYCAEMNMENRKIALYAFYGATNYQIFANNALGALPFGLLTNEETSYTITVSNVAGTETLKMKDEVTGTVFDLTEGYVYNFTADASSTNTSRFHLYVAPVAPEICHRYGKLQVSGSNGQSVAVKNMDDSATSIGTVAITADYQEIAVEGVLTPGQYKVEWNSKTLIIDVK